MDGWMFYNGDRCWKSQSLIILHKCLPQTTIFCSFDYNASWKVLSSVNLNINLDSVIFLQIIERKFVLWLCFELKFLKGFD